MSAYQTFKLYLLSLIPLTKDATHMYIGMLVLLIWVIGFRHPLHSLKSVIPVILVASVMLFRKRGGTTIAARRASERASFRLPGNVIPYDR